MMTTSSEKYQKIPHDDDETPIFVGDNPESVLQERRGKESSPSDGSYHQLNPPSEQVHILQISNSISPRSSQDGGEITPLSPSSQRSAPSLASLPLQHISKTLRIKSKTSEDHGDASVSRVVRHNNIFVPRGSELQHSHGLVRDDFDSDEEEADLGRYSFDFNHALGNNDGQKKSILSSYSSQQFRMPQDYQSDSNSKQWTRRYSKTVISPARRIFGSIKKARNESRRKRMERLLALDATSSKICFYTERCTICLSSYCDLLELKGFVLALMAIFAYSMIIRSLGDDQVLAKKLMLGLGIPFFVFRFMWRPFSWYVCRREREKVKNDQFRYNGPIDLSSSNVLGNVKKMETHIPII